MTFKQMTDEYVGKELFCEKESAKLLLVFLAIFLIPSRWIARFYRCNLIIFRYEWKHTLSTLLQISNLGLKQIY